jgi:hypothetical protein
MTGEIDLSAIRVGERHRKDMGDIAGLARDAVDIAAIRVGLRHRKDMGDIVGLARVGGFGDARPPVAERCHGQ